MEKLNEDYKNLSELVRTAYKLISPMTYHDDVDRLTPEFVMSDAKKRPGCYLKLGQGADHTLFPICNRYGYKDAKMIKFSLKLAKKIAERNVEHDTSTVILKLQKLLNKYDKPVPNTMSQAVLKGKSTKAFNQKMNLGEAGQIKAKKKLQEWGNSDLNKDDKAKKFVQDMYNIKEEAIDEGVAGRVAMKLAKKVKSGASGYEGSNVETLVKRYGKTVTAGAAGLAGGIAGRRGEREAGLKIGGAAGVVAGATAGTASVLLIKKLYDKFKKEKDPKKKAEIKTKILKAKKVKK